MKHTLTLAEEGGVSLSTSYSKGIGAFFASGFGQWIAIILGIIASILFICFIVAAVMRGMGRQNKFVSTFVGGAMQILCLCALIALLAGPTVVFPGLMKAGDALIKFFSSKTNSLTDEVKTQLIIGLPLLAYKAKHDLMKAKTPETI